MRMSNLCTTNLLYVAAREPPSKRAKTFGDDVEQISDEVYEDAVAKLKEEYSKKRGRNHADIKDLMETTQQKR